MIPGRPSAFLKLAFAVVALPWCAARAETPALLPGLVGATELYAPDPVSGVALGGRDPVAYQTEAAPRAGRAEFEAIWGGLAWRFVSQANRAAFLRDPHSFVPRLGGYDAEAAAGGLLVQADPEVFLVRSARLYLFRTPAARARFEAGQDTARRAEARWPGLKPKLVHS
jgi:hypothetical protein